jgi:hypothetical protein
MDFVLKVWQWLNGKKVVLSAVAATLIVVGDQLGILLPLLGVDGVVVAKVATAILAVVGVIHKIVKALA